MNASNFGVVQRDDTMRRAREAIDESGLQMVAVIDRRRQLCGVITDSDVRRAILKGMSTEALAEDLMNKDPIVGALDQSTEDLISVMRAKRLHGVPIVDSQRQFIEIKLLRNLEEPNKLSNRVVLMAGGLGTRLRPLTATTPKPLLKVGEKPIIQTQIERMRDAGFRHFYISVNYRGDMIKNFFEDGASFGVEISYLEEDERAGTAGALSLIEESLVDPLIVMNGDLLTKVDFNGLLEYHRAHRALATMCVKEYRYEVPFGVVETDEEKIIKISEKPIHEFFINAGIYALNAEVLTTIPAATFYDMPHLFENLIKQDKNACAFPIIEYWADIGTESDFELANKDYQLNFLN